MEERYNVYFAGQVMDGYESGSVRDKLARVFNADEATLDKLFSGKPQLIKRNCDSATAQKFKAALERAGAVPIIKVAGPAAATASRPARAMTAAEKIAALAAAPDENRFQKASAASPIGNARQDEPNQESGGIVLAPPGTEVLREEERAELFIREVDTSGLELDIDATRLSDELPPPPAAPDTSHLSMGAVGDAIPNLRSPVAPLSPNLDGLALSAPGTDFSDCAAPEPQATPMDLSGLSVLPPGAIPPGEQQRQRAPRAAPSIDHLSLSDEERR